MNTTHVERTDREVIASRLIDAPRALVFKVWTEPEHIAQWWGPTGFTNTVHEMNVKPGGKFRLTMHGPNGTDYPNLIVFKEVVVPEKLVYVHGNGSDDAPGNFHVTVTFEEKEGKTLLTMRSLFQSKSDLDYVIDEHGAFEGARQNMERMAAYLETRINLMTQLKNTNMSRVSTYLNFAGNTEEAFLFYKSVFGTEFKGGIQRFGEIPPMEGAPPMTEADKKLILHIELEILGGHILMATDAPESMGMKVKPGNNMHINLEPNTRTETKRLFDALSAGGEVTMELQDMFWGAYYGSCTDRYGINWMFNCNEKG
ncbi:MAG: SRPBCC domain-containing protein [Imperialibacter sp.]|uniref:SRPBCC domain-containing protein n=1 Tax=Imperialibacter sp. TaxID=2038411 RepID=UPI0032EFD65F